MVKKHDLELHIIRTKIPFFNVYMFVLVEARAIIPFITTAPIRGILLSVCPVQAIISKTSHLKQ